MTCSFHASRRAAGGHVHRWPRSSSSARPTSRPWGSCRRSSTSTLPSWMGMFAATIVCGVASARVLFQRRAGVRHHRGRGGGAGRRLRHHRPDHRAALGPQGVGRLVDVGRARDVGAGAVADLRVVSAAAPIRRTGFRAAVGGDWALRHVQRAVRLLVGQPLAHAASEDVRRADAAGRRWDCRYGFPPSRFSG